MVIGEAARLTDGGGPGFSGGFYHAGLGCSGCSGLHWLASRGDCIGETSGCDACIGAGVVLSHASGGGGGSSSCFVPVPVRAAAVVCGRLAAVLPHE